MTEVADNILPVFPFRVDWKRGVAERLDWLTAINAGATGNEQRQAGRLTPRREFEVTLTLWDQERQFWDLWLHRMVGTECMVPLWHDSVRTVTGATEGDSEIRADFRALEWQIGSLGLLRGATALSYEVVEVAAVEDDRLTLATPLEHDWPIGTRIEPLRRGRMTDQTNVSVKSDRASQTQALFELTHDQPYSEGVDSWDVFEDLPVLDQAPNRTSDIDMQYLWQFSQSDSQVGRRYRTSDIGRASVNQKHEWFLRGRDAKAVFRSMLYRLRGAQGAFWLPTFSEDMTLSRDAAAAASSIYVKAFGFAYTGSASSGRDRICIQRKNGTRVYRRIMGTLPSGNVAEERLMLNAGLPAGMTMAEVARISWMDTGRFENDRIEFNHINAADGMSTVTSIFKTFRNDRTAPAILSLPIPVAGKTSDPCGSDFPAQGDPCGPERPCPDYPVRVRMYTPAECQCNPLWDPSVNFDYPDINCTYDPVAGRYIYYDSPAGQKVPNPQLYPGGPQGRSLATLFSDRPDGSIYERDDFVNPASPHYQEPGYERFIGQLLVEQGRDRSTAHWDFHFPIYGHWYLAIQWPAFYCGSVGRDLGCFKVQMCRNGGLIPLCVCDFSDVVSDQVGGNIPFNFDWEF